MQVCIILLSSHFSFQLNSSKESAYLNKLHTLGTNSKKKNKDSLPNRTNLLKKSLSLRRKKSFVTFHLRMPTYRFPINGIRHHDFKGRLDELYELAPGKRMSISVEHDNVGEVDAAIVSQRGLTLL